MCDSVETRRLAGRCARPVQTERKSGSNSHCRTARLAASLAPRAHLLLGRLTRARNGCTTTLEARSITLIASCVNAHCTAMKMTRSNACTFPRRFFQHVRARVDAARQPRTTGTKREEPERQGTPGRGCGHRQRRQRVARRCTRASLAKIPNGSVPPPSNFFFEPRSISTMKIQ